MHRAKRDQAGAMDAAEIARAAKLGFEAAVFDLDGVVTQTAALHEAAWQTMFNDFLERRAAERGERFQPFDPGEDYLSYVDGMPRSAGTRRFLASRGIQVPEGDPSDDSGAATIHGLGARKDALFKESLRRDGVEVFATTIALIDALRSQGVKTAVVTSSKNGREVLRVANLDERFDARIDGLDAVALGLQGKPAPDPFLRAAELLDVAPGRAIVIEDANAGVEAGQRGGFGLVVGVARQNNRAALAAHGADLVVTDLSELDVAALDASVRVKRKTTTAWRIEQEGFDPAREQAMESLFTVGNGYLGVRGVLDTPLPRSEGDLFISGVYDRKHPDRPYSELEFLGLGRTDDPHAELVSLPFPFRLSIAVDRQPLDLLSPHWRTHHRTLDLRRGVLDSKIVYEVEPDRRTSVRTLRCASLVDRHLLLQEVTVCLENHSGRVDLDASLAAPELALRHHHLEVQDVDESDPALSVQRFRTQASGLEICVATRMVHVGSDRDALHEHVDSRIGHPTTFRRYIVVYTSRDVADPRAEAVKHLRALRWEDFHDALAAHSQRWRQVWEAADIQVDGSPATEQALRFNTYHLISAAARDPRTSIGARALSGRAYEGHVFWDVEIFMLPFYTHTCPHLARNLLLYRYNTLDGARERARELGFKGACYAWESTVTGSDVTPKKIRLKTTGREIPIFTGTQQIHVTADVACGVWSYWEATRDHGFLRDAGVEILVETARFWVDRSTRGAHYYHLRGVVGPDEYHHSVDDNAFTNWMARFNLEKAIVAVEWLRRESPRAWGALTERLGLRLDEPDGWATVARELYCPTPNSHGVIEQFAGFFDLKDYPLPRDERFRAPINRLFEWERINQLKLIKQADVLMLLHLFPEQFSRDVVAANYRYYEPMTDHGSSLSPGIHAAIAARLGLWRDAERYWRQSLWLDLSNTMGNSTLGVHPACMGGTWQALVYGFLGVRFTEEGPRPDPAAAARLPEGWDRVLLELAWRGRRYPIEVAR
jgi:beta-phosphoglucomutase family hydrolase